MTQCGHQSYDDRLQPCELEAGHKCTHAARHPVFYKTIRTWPNWPKRGDKDMSGLYWPSDGKWPWHDR